MLKVRLKFLAEIICFILGGLTGATEAPKSYGNLIIDILVDFPEKIDPKHQDILKALVPKSEPDLVDSTGNIILLIWSYLSEFHKIQYIFRSEYDTRSSNSRESQKYWR